MGFPMEIYHEFPVFNDNFLKILIYLVIKEREFCFFMNGHIHNHIYT